MPSDMPRDNNFESRQVVALEACKASLAWFAKNKRTARSLYYGSQVATITLSALTPVLILITDLPGWAQALPAALAAIAASLSSAFNWKENWIRRSTTFEFLLAEKTRYETRSSSAYTMDLSEDEALNNFVQRMTELNLMEVSNWEKAVSNRTESRVEGQRNS